MNSHSVSDINNTSLLKCSSSRNLQSSVSYGITQFNSNFLCNIHLSLKPVTKQIAFVDFFGGQH